MPAEPQPLNARTLGYWRDRLPVPAYDRDLVTPGVVHIGVGGFHRAHQALYLDDLAERHITLDWGERGVGLLPGGWRIGLIRHPRLRRMMIPGGHVEPEESPAEAVVSEIKAAGGQAIADHLANRRARGGR